MFRGKAIKEKLRKGEAVLQVMLRFPSPEIAELFALNGIDLIVIDNEHYLFDPQTMISIVRAANAGGAACVVRLPNGEPSRVAQVMDYGMDGIWLPSCSSYEAAKGLVDAVKFAPIGKRGFCPITRAASYGHGSTPIEYADASNANSLIMIQVETKEGVEDLDRILTIPEIDTVSTGPSDLSASYGVPGQYKHPVVLEAVKTIREKATAAGINARGSMCHTVEEITAAYEAGYRNISVGSDQQILVNNLKKMIGAVRDWQAEHK